MEIVQFVTESLGDASYLVVSGDRAAVVDPQRDVRPYLEAAGARGATIEMVFETHVHNDYVSGGRELAALGAEVVAPANGHLEFPHRPVGNGDRVRLGEVTLEAMAAPGHTYEHTVYLAADESGTTRGAFTGGGLLMGSAGRSDLLGPEHTETLTRHQWESGRRLAARLPGTAEILPTHGAGSFCSSSGTDVGRRAALSVERLRNPLLLAGTYEEFRALHLALAMPIPGYYPYMAPINRKGPRVWGTPPVPRELTPDDLGALLAGGTRVLDVRPRLDFITAHVTGSQGMEESGSLLAYVGWLIPFNAPLALVSSDAAQASRVAVDLFRIGYEDVRGFLPFAAWQRAGGDTEAPAVVSAAEVADALDTGRRPVIDVRFAYETEQRPLPGAIPLPIDSLPALASAAPHDALVVCESGQRAAIAASFLAGTGRKATPMVAGGAADVLALIGVGRSR